MFLGLLNSSFLVSRDLGVIRSSFWGGGRRFWELLDVFLEGEGVFRSY